MADVTINDLTGQVPTTSDLFPFATAVSPSTYKASLAQIKTALNIPAAQIQSDWTQTNTGLLDYIKNKPTIPSTTAVAKAYARFNPAGTLDGSYNVLSVAKNQAQDYTVTFASSLGIANYITVGTITYANWSLCGWGVTTVIVKEQTATSVRVLQVRADGACGQNTDFTYLNIVCF
jgi:hypothetical protein